MMVIFNLIKSENEKHYFEYFPEGDMSLKGGIIVLDETEQKIYVSEVAEEDFYSIIDVDELKDTRDFYNNMRIENGEQPLTEEEWPIETEDMGYYWYADHAIDVISKAYNKDGTIIKKGSAYWY